MITYGAIEAGGTKFICAVGSSPENLNNIIRIPTTDPKETLNRVIEYFLDQNSKNQLAAIGIGSFGPVNLNKNSDTYGYITSTPKQGWANTNFAGIIREALNLPVGFDTDVNAAILGEQKWGAAQNVDNAIYITIGTGIGGGVIVNGKIVHGLQHPELGHIFIPQDRGKDSYPGKCLFHKNCFEGLAAGPALKERWGVPAEELNEEHPAWELEAEYISSALCNYICTYSPQIIIVGGGVFQNDFLLPLVHEKTVNKLNGYFQLKEITGDIENYIVTPDLETRSGILGAIVIAEIAYREINTTI